MGAFTRAEACDLSRLDLGWMVGRAVEGFTLHDPRFWMISLSGGGRISTEDVWRVLTRASIAAISEDHGHAFGLPAPVDAAAVAMAAISRSAIADARVDDRAPDLLVTFENGAVLEVLASSVGYECGHVADPWGRHTVVRGDRTASTWMD